MYRNQAERSAFKVYKLFHVQDIDNHRQMFWCFPSLSICTLWGSIKSTLSKIKLLTYHHIWDIFYYNVIIQLTFDLIFLFSAKLNIQRASVLPPCCTLDRSLLLSSCEGQMHYFTMLRKENNNIYNNNNNNNNLSMLHPSKFHEN